jgi:hypothetical protein
MLWKPKAEFAFFTAWNWPCVKCEQNFYLQAVSEFYGVCTSNFGKLVAKLGMITRCLRRQRIRIVSHSISFKEISVYRKNNFDQWAVSAAQLLNNIKRNATPCSFICHKTAPFCSRNKSVPPCCLINDTEIFKQRQNRTKNINTLC